MNTVDMDERVNRVSVPKRRWVTPEISSLRVEKTALNNFWFGEINGANGCTSNDSVASTNICVAT